MNVPLSSRVGILFNDKERYIFYGNLLFSHGSKMRNENGKNVFWLARCEEKGNRKGINEDLWV